MPSSGQWKPTGQRRHALVPRFGWYVPSGHRVKFLFESPGQKAPFWYRGRWEAAMKKEEIGHFAGIMHALTGWIFTFLRVDDGLTVHTKLLHDGIPLYLGTGKDGRRIGPHAETPARACLLHRVRNPIGGEIQAVVGHFHEESLAISV